MKRELDEILAGALERWVRAICRHGSAVAALILLVTLPLAAYTARNLGINSDNTRLVGPDLEFRRAGDAFDALFPSLSDALLIVIDAPTAEVAREATASLRTRLLERDDRFTDVYEPAGGSFFERHGLLYRSLDDLDEFADRMARMQPIIAELERDASIANLTSLIRLGLDSAADEGLGTDDWAEVLDRVGAATVELYQEYPVAVSWEELMLRGSALEVQRRHVLVAHPILEFESLLAASEALKVIYAEARALDLTHERGIEIRVTGNPALNYEEMIGLAWDIGGGGAFCFLMVALVLRRAFRSLRLAAASIATLLVGMVWTAAFAALAIGHLNLISISFAILFIGLGVDFCIHLGMRFAERIRAGSDPPHAMGEAARGVGGSLVICAVTTAIGFFVFIPTQYLGVAELGAIAGAGMFVILFLALTFFPALLSSWLRVDAQQLSGGTVVFRRSAGWRWLDRHPFAVRRAALAAGLLGLALLPRARFDPNVIAMRDPTTASVRAFNDLLEESGMLSPWYLNAVADDLESARAVAARVETLDVVDATLTLSDYIPTDQAEKLEILEDISFLMDAQPAAAKPPGDRLSPEEQVRALRDLHAFLGSSSLAASRTSLGRSMLELRAQLEVLLERVERDENPQEALASLEDLLLSGLPGQLQRLREALAAEAIERADLPPRLVRRMLAPGGIARVQIFPSEALNDAGSFERFADGVREVVPDATGVAVNLIEFGRAVQDAFRQALISAVLVIALLLIALWRNVADTLLALTPLLLAAVLTAASVGIAGIAFNFANVIVIPLLLGIGVDSGIHLVHRSKQTIAPGESLLQTTTARAVFYSALTTLVSFGSLAFSSHLGMRGLGLLLVFGMVLTVLSNLVVLPALIAWRRR